MPPVSGSPVARTLDLPALSFRAGLTPQSANKDDRTVALDWTTGAGVERMDYWTGDRYVEKLSLDKNAVRLDRLNSGAPLLDTHRGSGLANILGVVEPGSASVTSKRGQATVRFSARDDVQPFYQDVLDGIIGNVSVGYRVYEYEVTPPKKNSTDLPVWTAVDWEPYELSLVPMPADAGARVRDGNESKVGTNPCRITVRAAAEESKPMDPKQSETIAENNPLEAETPKPTAAAPERKAEPSDADLARRAETDRVTQIIAACRATRMSQDFQDKLIKDEVPLVDAQRQVFEELRKRGGDDRGPQVTASARVSVGDDPLVHSRAGIENAILHRVSPAMFELNENGRRYRGMTLIDVAKAMLNARGIRTSEMSKNEIAAHALGLRSGPGYHTTSDFVDLLDGVVNKTLLKAYEEAPQTYKTIARQISAVDFKTITLLQLGEGPALAEVGEHGEYKRGSITTSKETFRIKKYGRIFAITREVIVNDDVDAFSRVPLLFGRASRALEQDVAWARVTSNPTMGDGNALFSAAHSNLETDGDVISIASLSRGRKAIRMQTGLDGETLLNLSPKYLIVPPSLETVAQQYVANIQAITNNAVNPFAGTLSVVVEPRLEDASSTAWYLAVSPDQADVLVYAYLEGQAGPVVEQRVGFDIDGVEFKARLDFGAEVVDFRGIHKDPGELVS